ncbi:hypothetical protein RBH76_10565 [Oscillospiraceae bacterium MB24-C1]|nr:hypothetical protein RBH76_10565 [Oscillospiraceae bacterium MB24-C1]
MKTANESKALRCTANMLGGTEQKQGISRTAASHCIAGADRIDELQRAFALACRIIDDNSMACLADNQSWQNYILERVRTEPVCRVCGCIADNACSGGCYWVATDLCSACAQFSEEETESKYRHPPLSAINFLLQTSMEIAPPLIVKGE